MTHHKELPKGITWPRFAIYYIFLLPVWMMLLFLFNHASNYYLDCMKADDGTIFVLGDFWLEARQVDGSTDYICIVTNNTIPSAYNAREKSPAGTLFYTNDAGQVGIINYNATVITLLEKKETGSHRLVMSNDLGGFSPNDTVAEKKWWFGRYSFCDENGSLIVEMPWIDVIVKWIRVLVFLSYLVMIVLILRRNWETIRYNLNRIGR